MQEHYNPFCEKPTPRALSIWGTEHCPFPTARPRYRWRGIVPATDGAGAADGAGVFAAGVFGARVFVFHTIFPRAFRPHMSSFVRSCVRAFVRSFVRAFVRSCVRSFVRVERHLKSSSALALRVPSISHRPTRPHRIRGGWRALIFKFASLRIAKTANLRRLRRVQYYFMRRG